MDKKIAVIDVAKQRESEEEIAQIARLRAGTAAVAAIQNMNEPGLCAALRVRFIDRGAHDDALSCFGLKDDDDLFKHLLKMGLTELVALTVVDDVVRFNYYEDDFAALLKLLKIDIKKITAAVKKEKAAASSRPK